MALAIETTALARRFGTVRAVDGIDLAVPEGSVYGFLGPNGSGKTTTIRMLLGLVRPSAGTARVLGETVGPGAPVVRRAGALVERPAFYPFLTPLENLLLFGVTAGASERELRARIPALVERVGLREAADRTVGAFSTGMLQRLALALAILRDPPLLILDEPTNGLDPAGVAEVRALIGALAAEGTTVFLSTHVLTEVEQVCDRVAILDRGRIVTQSTTADLLAGDGAVQVRFDDAAEAEAATRILAGTGWTVRRADGSASLTVVGAAGGSAIVRALGASAIYPAEVRADRTSLESVFLELTRDAAASDASGSADRAGNPEDEPKGPDAGAGTQR